MKRKGLFFIGLTSAILTIISLNIVVGRPYYNDRFHYGHRHSCNSMQDHRYDERYEKDHRSFNDTTQHNY